MKTDKFPLSPPTLDELARILAPALKENYKLSSIDVVQCPDLRKAPFELATEGLCGNERIADVGGQPNLFPKPRLECKFSLPAIAEAMEMDPKGGSLIGAGAGPFHVIGTNSELAANLSWKDGFENLDNRSHYACINRQTGAPSVKKSPCADCALMINLFGSLGQPGPVLKIIARGRKGTQKSFTDCIRHALHATYGDSHPISLGGAFVIKSGRSHYHIMPDFPSQDFTSAKELNEWLTYHDFDAPIVCLSVLHSADPGKKMGLRMEHTHCFGANGEDRGGHYHYDLDEGREGEVEYEAYFNTAKVVYRVDRPEVTLERDLHD